jgi:hypothetical protein
MDFSIFGEVSAETIWGKMYDYRSSLAHGNEPDFNKNLKILKDRRSAGFTKVRGESHCSAGTS